MSCVQRSGGDSRDLQDVDKHGEYEPYTCNERTTLLKAGQLKLIPELCRGCSKPDSVAQGHGSARAPRCPPASPREGQGTHSSGEVGRRAEKPPHLSVETGPLPKRHAFCKQASSDRNKGVSPSTVAAGSLPCHGELMAPARSRVQAELPAPRCECSGTSQPCHPPLRKSNLLTEADL